MNCICDGCSGKIDIELGFRNVENYGDKSLNFKCPKCKKMIKIYFRRVVEVKYAQLTEEKDESFNI